MLMPRNAVMIAVTATKMPDLISGLARPARFISRSPDYHPGSAEQRRDEPAAAGRQRRRQPPERESGKLPDEFGFRGRSGRAAWAPGPESTQRGRRSGGAGGTAADGGCLGPGLGTSGRRAGSVVEVNARERDRIAMRPEGVAVDRGVVCWQVLARRRHHDHSHMQPPAVWFR